LLAPIDYDGRLRSALGSVGAASAREGFRLTQESLRGAPAMSDVLFSDCIELALAVCH